MFSSPCLTVVLLSNVQAWSLYQPKQNLLKTLIYTSWCKCSNWIGIVTWTCKHKKRYQIIIRPASYVEIYWIWHELLKSVFRTIQNKKNQNALGSYSYNSDFVLACSHHAKGILLKMIAKMLFPFAFLRWIIFFSQLAVISCLRTLVGSHVNKVKAVVNADISYWVTF